MLNTPLGNILVSKDGKLIDYNYKKINLDKNCEELDGRYVIEINFEPDGNEHIIKCFIEDYISNIDDGINSGERLELYTFNNDNYELSIGMEAIIGIGLNDYDYDAEYYNDGVSYNILNKTKTKKYVFGVAWINKDKIIDMDNETSTWYGADPTLIK